MPLYYGLKQDSMMIESHENVCNRQNNRIQQRGMEDTDNVGYTSKRLLSYIANQLSVLK